MSNEFIIGIDLGTTQCCVCMPSTSESNIEKKVEIITDDFGGKTTPSVVTEDSEGNIIVGHVAKQRAGRRPKPIFFIKRSMGTTNTQKLKGKDCTPVEISAEILKHLKKMAAKYLRVDDSMITKAVICVPAYFGLLLQNDTQKAAELAGFEIPEGGILQEPIAAAMAYGLENKRKDLNIFCFDFGGGTFDATILCKENGQFIEEDLAFGGDPYLGGYDFDKLLANYILNKLRKKGKGYKLNLDFNNEEDDARYQILLMIAEKYKHLLSDYPEVSVWEESTRTFNDQAGNSVNIDMTLTIKEFNALIIGESDKNIEEEIQKDLNDQELENIEKKIQNRPASVRKTMYLSQIVLKKAKLFPEEIDEVIMVGGSSYIPLVQQELENLFGRKPKLVDPDSTIAKGAALRAATFIGKGIPGLKFTRLPEKSPLAKVNIIGQLDAGIINAKLSKVKLQLSRTDGAYEGKISPDSKGNFIFNNVELIEEDGVESNFILTATTDSNNELLSYNFSIVYGSEDDKKPELIVTTQPIRIDTVDGKKTLFPAGKRLPFTEDIHGLETSDQSGILRIPFFEGHQFVGEIKIEGLNTSLPVGTPIELRVNISKDQKLAGWANVPADNKKEGDVTTTLFMPPIPSIEEMNNDFEDLKDNFDESIKQVPDINIKLKYKNTGEDLIKNIKDEFKNKPAVKEKIYNMLQELKDMIKDIEGEVILKPSLEEFNIKVKEASDLDSKNKFAKEITANKEEGNKAFREKNKRLWQDINKNLDNILAQLRKTNGNDFWKMWNNLSKEQKTMFLEIEMRKWLIEDIRELSKEAQDRGIANKYGDKLRDVERQLNELDSRSDPEKALEKWFDLRNEIDKLRYEITGETPTEEEDEGKPRKRT